MIFGFDEMTVALLFIFAFFVLVAYSILRLVFKVAVIAILSMTFPIALNYFGLYGNISVNNILIFGILGSFLYITHFFVYKLLGLVWPAFGVFTKKEKPAKNKRLKKKHKKEEDEVEISG